MVIEQRVIFIWTLVIFMSLPTLSKIYFVTFRHQNVERRESNEINLLREANKGTHSRSFLDQLVSILTQNRTQHMPTTKKRCVAHFGSMYGPHGHRQRCLESTKKKTISSLLPNDYLYKEFHQWHYEPFHYDDIMYFEHEYPFLDFTKNEGPKSLSDDIRSSTNEDLRSESPIAILLLTGYRRNYPRFSVTKRNTNMQTSEESDDEKKNSDYSDTSSGSVDEDSFTETDVKKSNKQIKKPKRFQVIDNQKVSNSKDKPEYEVASDGNSESTDTDGELTESNNKKKAKGMKQKRVEKTIKTDQQATKNEIYLQGNRYVDPSSVFEKDSRKRLQSFLPKRYHWIDDEIHDLGYYWFNGPQGKYQHYYAESP